MNTFRKILITGILTIIMFAPFGVFYVYGETGDYEPLAPIPEVRTTGGSGGLNVYLQDMITLIIGVIGVLSVIMITIGGVQYMTSEAMGSKEAGRDKIKAAIYGLILVALSYLILNTINPDILNIKI